MKENDIKQAERKR